MLRKRGSLGPDSTAKNRRNVGRDTSSSVCLFRAVPTLAKNAKRGGDFASHCCVALAWDILFYRVRPARKEF